MSLKLSLPLMSALGRLRASSKTVGSEEEERSSKKMAVAVAAYPHLLN